MPRIRSIKPEFWTDDKIISLPHIARLFFIGVWNFADDYGALQDKPEQLRLLILPSETDMNAEQALDLLISCDLVERYVDETRDESFLMIKNWGRHQKVDHPTKSRIIPERYKKVVIPQSVRREVAIKYGCLPGSENMNECYFCGDPGKIYWTKKSNGSPSGWVSFSHELSHIIPEQEGGETSKGNIVLCCRNCNRSMGVRNAFDWLFSGKYTTNQTKDNISKFRENSRKFEKSIESSLLIGKDKEGIRKGEEGIGADFQLLTIYNKKFDELNGSFKDLSKPGFETWKKFIDFIYKNKLHDLFKFHAINPQDFEKLDFPEKKWEETVRAILATGIEEKHNLFFRIPQFIKYGLNSTKGGTKSEGSGISGTSVIPADKQYKRG